ncbi:MAG: heme-copper oxidase subunit III [Candidatus Baltobacteraceae bacterium]
MALGQRPLPVRAHPIVFGTVIFIASETMFFAALFATYYNLKARSMQWPPSGVHLDMVGPAVGTACLLLSSLATAFALASLRRRLMQRVTVSLYAGILGGIAYIVDAMHGYASQSFGLRSGAYGSIYVTMTGFHLLHVVAGVIMLLGLYLGIRSPAFRVDRNEGAEAISYYWHFVTVMWIGIYCTIYWIR